MARKSKKIDSMETLMAAVPVIIEQINADQKLALRFLANPLLLAEELGYTLTPEMRHFAARRMRFSTAAFERLNTLEAEIWTHAGEQFDIDAPEALTRVLDEKLQILRVSAPTKKKRGRKPKAKPETAQAAPVGEPLVQVTQLPARVVTLHRAPAPPVKKKRGRKKSAVKTAADATDLAHAPIDDPLEQLRDRHPIMPPLLEYRQLEASTARLAPRAVYDRVASGEVELPISNFKLHLKLSSQG